MPNRTRWILLGGLLAVVPVVSRAQALQGADTAIRPFTIRVPDAVLADLKARLANARFPDPLQGDGWTYGADIGYVRHKGKPIVSDLRVLGVLCDEYNALRTSANRASVPRPSTVRANWSSHIVRSMAFTIYTFVRPRG